MEIATPEINTPEPEYHSERIEQVVGRAVRVNSQQNSQLNFQPIIQDSNNLNQWINYQSLNFQILSPYKLISSISEFEDINDYDCPICINKLFDETKLINKTELSDDDKLCKLSCNCKYYFHKKCIDDWITVGKKKSCPFCKSECKYYDKKNKCFTYSHVLLDIEHMQHTETETETQTQTQHTEIEQLQNSTHQSYFQVVRTSFDSGLMCIEDVNEYTVNFNVFSRMIYHPDYNQLYPRISRIRLDMINSSNIVVAREIVGLVGTGEEVVKRWDLDNRDILLVMDQSHASYNKSVISLINNNNDLVNAIMELTI